MVTVQVYIVHAKFMDVRKDRMNVLKTMLEKGSPSLQFSVEYVDEFDPNTIVQSDINTSVNLAKTNSGELFDNLVKNMHINQISNALKHKAAIIKGSNSTADFVMVVEDDVLYGDDVASRLSDICGQLQQDPAVDILFLGLPSMTPIDEMCNLFRKSSEFYRLLPCCDSYIASRASMKKLADNFGHVKFTTNIQLSWVCETHNISMYMTSPNVFLDGTKYGAYLSSVDPNSRLIFNPDFNKLAALVNKPSYTAADDTIIQSALENIKFKNHPDVMHVEAQYLIAKKNYKKAETILENVYSIVSQNGCIINTETEFLRTHMRIYKHLQT
jgi:hypothetical protein